MLQGLLGKREGLEVLQMWVPGLSKQQKLVRGQIRNSGRPEYVGYVLSKKGAKTNNRLPCSLPEERRADFLNGVKMREDWWAAQGM